MAKVHKMDGTTYHEGEFEEGGPSSPPDPHGMNEATSRAVDNAKAYMAEHAGPPHFIPAPPYGGWTLVNEHALALYKLGAPEDWAANLIASYCYHWPDREHVVEAAKRVRVVFDKARYHGVSPLPFDADKYKLKSIDDADAAPAIEWIVWRLMIAGGLFFVYAKEKVGKTTLLLDLCLCRATGRSFGGLETMPGRSVYIYGEGNEGALAAMLNAWLIVNSKPGQDRAALRKLVMENFRYIEKPVSVSNPADLHGFNGSLRWMNEHDEGKGLLVVDTMLMNIEGNINDPEIQRAFVAGCANVRRTHKATVAVAHHKSDKPGAKDMYGGKVVAFSMDGGLEMVMDAAGTKIIAQPSRIRSGDSNQPAFVFRRRIVAVPRDRSRVIDYSRARDAFDDLDGDTSADDEKAFEAAEDPKLYDEAPVLHYVGRDNRKEDKENAKAAVNSDPEFKLLQTIQQHKKLSVRKLADLMEVTRYAATCMVDDLRRRGLVSKKGMTVTAKGEKWMADPLRQDSDENSENAEE